MVASRIQNSAARAADFLILDFGSKQLAFRRLPIPESAGCQIEKYKI